MPEKPRVPGKRLTGEQTGPSKPAEKLFTKEQVNDMMRKRVERSHQAFFKRYGVKDLDELDNLIGKSRSYDPMKQRFDDLEKSDNELKAQHLDLTKRYAYKVGNVDSNKISDIEAYMKGKGLEINETNLMNELKNHPEWVNRVSSVEVLGSEATTPPTVDSAEMAGKLLGVDLV